MFGQTQVDGGVVIDSSNLNSVRIINSGGRRAVEAGPGALWGPVLDAAYVNKLTPPVNVEMVRTFRSAVRSVRADSAGPRGAKVFRSTMFWSSRW